MNTTTTTMTRTVWEWETPHHRMELRTSRAPGCLTATTYAYLVDKTTGETLLSGLELDGDLRNIHDALMGDDYALGLLRLRKPGLAARVKTIR